MKLRLFIHGITYALLIAIGLMTIQAKVNHIEEKRQRSIASFEQQYKLHGVPVRLMTVKKQPVQLKEKITLRQKQGRNWQAFVDRETLASIEIGTPVLVQQDRMQFETKVRWIDHSLDLATGLFELEVSMPKDFNANHSWYAADLIVRLSGQGILMPVEHVELKGEKAFVWRVQNQQAERVEIKLGKSDGYNVVVLSGLHEGDELILGKSERIKDGVKVLASERSSKGVSKGETK